MHPAGEPRMIEHEDQLRRDAAALADGIDRDLHIALAPLAGNAERVRDMALELTVASDDASFRIEALDASREAAGGTAIEELAATASVLRSLAGELHVVAERSIRELEASKAHLVQAIRANALGNRRRYERFEVDVPAEARFAGRIEPARVFNLSLGGARIDLAINKSVGTPVTLRIDGLGHELVAAVVRVTDDGTQLRFTIGDAAAEALRRLLEQIGASKSDIAS